VLHVLDTHADPLGQDLATNALVNDDADGALGDVEHTPSLAVVSLVDRVHANEVKKKEAKTTGKKGAPCKRLPAPPKEAHLVSTKDNEPQVLGPIPFEFMA
jgi:hypothetical protein